MIVGCFVFEVRVVKNSLYYLILSVFYNYLPGKKTFPDTICKIILQTCLRHIT